MDLNEAYNNVDFIPEGKSYEGRWAADAAEHRSLEQGLGRAYLNLPYGDTDRQRYDLFYPAGRPEGLVVFVHGGYWRRFDRSFWSHFTAGPVARGWAVAVPSHTLAPMARISAITQEIAQAVTTAADRIAGPLVLTGHSAGGHLVARMVQAGGPLSEAVAGRVVRCVPISPVSDLRPLVGLELNADLRLDPAEAAAESPMLGRPQPGISLSVWVGADERPVFLDQARWLAEAWDAPLHVPDGLHHFDVIDGLKSRDSDLTRDLLEPVAPTGQGA